VVAPNALRKGDCQMARRAGVIQVQPFHEADWKAAVERRGVLGGSNFNGLW
jgi:hypothetical protein